MKSRPKGILTSDPTLASELAYQLRIKPDVNAVIFERDADQRAIALASDLAGINKSNSCPVWAKCRISPVDPAAPRVYVACLASYTNGHLHGWWLDAATYPELLADEIEDMLLDSPMEDVEEWAIHSYENFGNLSISEGEDLENVCAWANLLADFPNQKGAVSAYIDLTKSDGVAISSHDFESRYLGHWLTIEEFAIQSSFVEEHYDFSSLQKTYPFWAQLIDWSRVARELEVRGDIELVSAQETMGCGFYIFRSAN